MKRDNLHFTFRTIDGYNKAFSAVISEREAGKTTAAWLDKVYKSFKDFSKPSIILRRFQVDITDVYIQDLQEIINKFDDNEIEINYKKGSLKEGIANIYINDKLFVRVIALSNPLSRNKSLIVRNVAFMIFDEFICNPKLGEKYLKGEEMRFKELYNTFQRENPGLKCYFLGNPYSLYNPYFTWWGVDTKKLHPGAIVEGSNWVIQCYQICDDLRQKILESNPLYEFDDSYKKYAFSGIAINDINIPIANSMNNATLRFVIRINDKNLGIFQSADYLSYHCEILDISKLSKKRKIWCLNFDDIENRCVLLNNEDRVRFNSFIYAIRENRIDYQSIECYYLIKEVYSYL